MNINLYTIDCHARTLFVGCVFPNSSRFFAKNQTHFSHILKGLFRSKCMSFALITFARKTDPSDFHGSLLVLSLQYYGWFAANVGVCIKISVILKNRSSKSEQFVLHASLQIDNIFCTLLPSLGHRSYDGLIDHQSIGSICQLLIVLKFNIVKYSECFQKFGLIFKTQLLSAELRMP